MAAFAERVRELRKERGLTQKQVADSCGIADSAIRKYESGKVTPKYEMLQRIADALGVRPGELMGLKDYGNNIWGPEGLTSEDLEDIRHRTLLLSENQKLLMQLKERMAKTEHIEGKLGFLNDDGLDVAVRVIDAIVGNPTLSTHPYCRPYFKPTVPPQDTPPPSEGKDTTPPPDAPETAPEGE